MMKTVRNHPVQFILRTASCAVQTWWEFLRTLFFLHLLVIFRIFALPLHLLSLPLRVLSALHRQKHMEIRLQKMKKALEAALWERKELKQRLELAVREREMMLKELESEYDETTAQIEVLVTQVKELKGEIQKYKKDRSSINDQTKKQNDLKTTSSNKLRRAPRNDEDNMEESVVASQRTIAVTRSLFSAILSFVVAMVVWEANDPCIPLVMAQLVVVAMSLTCVVRFFKALECRLYNARDAMTLMCFNCFLLGTFIYPILSLVACMLKDIVFNVS